VSDHNAGYSPEIQLDWCEAAVAHPAHREVQANRRIRLWYFVRAELRWLRVVLEPDGETIHNAFFDRSFKPPKP
jgi:hypothetical protein